MLQIDIYLTVLVTLFICKVYLKAEDIHVRYIETQEGSDLLLDCNVTDNDNVTVFWIKNDTHSSFIQSGKRLQFKDIKQNNAGYYICHTLETSLPAYNRTDVNKTVNGVYIVVKYKKQVDITNSRPNVHMEHEEQNSNNTSDDDNDDDDDEYIRTQMIVVLTLSAVGTVGIVIFLVYLLKYRKPRKLIYVLQ